MQNFRVKIYAPNGKRRHFGARFVASADWTDERYGGWTDFSLATTARIDELSTIVNGDIVEFYVLHEGAWNLRYRGVIENRQSSKSDPDNLTFSGFGKYHQVSRQVADLQLLLLGSPDISQIAADFMQTVVSPVFPSLYISTSNVGAVKTGLEAFNREVGDVLDELVKGAGNLAQWGMRAESDGRDSLFYGGVNTGPRPDFTITVPGRVFGGGEGGRDTSDLRNILHLIGGTPRFPNLLANGNFRLLQFAGSDSKNYLKDPSFEGRNAGDWTRVSGASWKSGGLSEGPAFDGNTMVLLDNDGEEINQEHLNDSTLTFVPGASYSFSVYLRRTTYYEGGGASAGQGKVYLEWYDASGSILQHDEHAIDCPNASWLNYAFYSTCPTGATGFKFGVIKTGAGSIVADFCQMLNSSVIYQQNWECVDYGSAAVRQQIWNDRTSPRFGTYCIRIAGTSSDADFNDVHFQPKNFTGCPVDGGNSYRFDIWVRSGKNEDGTLKPLPKIYMSMEDRDASNSAIIKDSYELGTCLTLGTWKQYSFERQVDQNAKTCVPHLRVRGDFDFYIDGASFRDATSPKCLPAQQVNAGEIEYEFIPDGPYQMVLSVTDVMTQGTPEYNSIDTYGRWPKVETAESVTDLASANAFAFPYFSVFSCERFRGSVELKNDTRPFRAGVAVNLAGANGKLLSSILRTVVRVKWHYDGGFTAQTDLDEEIGDPMIEFSKWLREQQLKGGGGIYSSSGSFSTAR